MRKLGHQITCPESRREQGGPGFGEGMPFGSAPRAFPRSKAWVLALRNFGALGGGAADCVSKGAEQHCKDLTSRLLAPKSVLEVTQGENTPRSQNGPVGINLDFCHLSGLAERPR